MPANSVIRITFNHGYQFFDYYNDGSTVQDVNLKVLDNYSSLIPINVYAEDSTTNKLEGTYLTMYMLNTSTKKC